MVQISHFFKIGGGLMLEKWKLWKPEQIARRELALEIGFQKGKNSGNFVDLVETLWKLCGNRK